MSSGAPTLGGIRRLATVTVRDLNVTGTLTTSGAITDNSDLTLANGKAVQSDTTTGHTAKFNAYDVDGTAYKTFATLTNGNTPSFAIAAPAGGTVSIDGATIGGTTPAAGSFTTLSTTGDTTVGDATNLILGSATGTKIGTSATAQKLGFFNATPVVQPTSANEAAVATTAVSTAAGIYGFTTAAQGNGIITLLNQIRADLVTLGLIKGS